MLSAINAKPGTFVQSNLNWDSLTRSDVYRQRVLGSDAGQKDFISLDDKRKLSKWQFALYMFFLFLTVNFCWTRTTTTAAYQVNSAIFDALYGTPYEVTPTAKTYAHIKDLSDVRMWLLNAFPAFMCPAVQEQNIPIGTIRLTLRRIQQPNNTISRFAALSPHAWEYGEGIGTTSLFTNKDDKDSFGAYRSWLGITENKQKGLSLNWQKELENEACKGGQLLDTIDQTGVLKDEVQKVCQNWCELLVEPSTCRCFTISGNYQCNFYSIPIENLEEDAGDGGAFAAGAAVQIGLKPRTKKQQIGTFVHYPEMFRFRYESERTGYRGTSGYVMQVNYYKEDQLIGQAMAQDPQVTPWTQGQMIANQVQDFVAGGMLSNSTATFVIDFVTYNVQYQMFSWVQLKFKVIGSGMVQATTQLNTLQITTKQMASAQSDMFAGFQGTDWIYFSLVMYFVIVEVIEMFNSGCGSKYLKPGWNWLTMMSLAFQVGTMLTWAAFVASMNFTSQLGVLNSGSSDISSDVSLTAKDIGLFEVQMQVYEQFRTISSFNLLFAFFAVVHYMNDTIPRVKVLIDTLHRSMTPIIFLLVIVLAAFVGYMFWSYAMFGSLIDAFKDVDDSTSSNIQFQFGKVDFFYELRKSFPFAGVVYFVSYMMIFFFIMQRLSTAVVLASYGDACAEYSANKREEEKRKAATESDTNQQDIFMRCFRSVVLKRIKDVLPESPPEPETQENIYMATDSFKRGPACLYFVFVVTYIGMTYMMTQIELSHTMMKTASTAVERPIFSTVLPVSNKISYNNNFSTVSTQNDVARYLLESLPFTMFNTSSGTFDGKPNPLLKYASALRSGEDYQQLVINNWNIVLGQKPVRISARYFALTEASETIGEVKGVIKGDTSVRKMVSGEDPVQIDPYGIPRPSSKFMEARTVEGIENNLTKQVLANRCNYTAAYNAQNETDFNGWACMLSVDRAETMEILEEMYEKNFVNNQTAVIVVDFVLYNGYAEVFAYVSIVFGFQPDGSVTKDLHVFTVRLDLYHDALSWLRVLTEFICIVLTCFYFGKSAGTLLSSGSTKMRRGSEHNSGKLGPFQKLFLFIRGIIEHVLTNPFVIMDVMSCMLTLVSFGFWYGYVLGSLREDYYFQEFPTWNKGKCDAAGWSWCSDQDVMRLFGQIVSKLRVFVQVLSINTVFIFMRSLEYLVSFNRIKVIFNSFYRGLEDIMWFIVVLFVVLFGYLAGMNQLFGSNVDGLNSITNALRYCFEMFMGNFDYTELRAVAPVAAIFFFFSFQVIFKFMLFNMFLAILDKNMREEDDDMLAAESKLKEIRRAERALMYQDAEPTTMIQKLKLLIFPPKTQAPSKGVGDTDAKTALTDNAAVANVTSQATATSGAEVTDGSGEPTGVGTKDVQLVVEEISEATVKAQNWHKLPQEMRTWAIDTSITIDKFVTDFANKRLNAAAQKKKVDQSQLDQDLQDAETKIKDKRKKATVTQTEVKRELERDQLTSLKEIHQDQESLSWYIMKREAELKKLETTKQEKQKRIEQMVQAAKSLISAEDDKPPASDDMDMLDMHMLGNGNDRRSPNAGMMALEGNISNNRS